MNLRPVNAGWKFRFHCRECGKMKWSDTKTHVDLDHAYSVNTQGGQR
jgi:hypothetical protein